MNIDLTHFVLPPLHLRYDTFLFPLCDDPSVLFLVDDLGFADVSFHPHMYGNSSNVIDTPHVDALARAGVRLEKYYVQPVCSPTRSTLLSGRYPIHHGIHLPIVSTTPAALPEDEVTLADKLREAGYRNYMVGKWHVGKCSLCLCLASMAMPTTHAKATPRMDDDMIPSLF